MYKFNLITVNVNADVSSDVALLDLESACFNDADVDTINTCD